MISRQKGISLIEVLLSILLISVGVVGLVKLQAYMDKKSEYAIRSIYALHLAESKLEYFRSRSAAGEHGTVAFDTIKSGEDDEDENGYKITWEVTSPSVSSELNGTLKRIEITASWNDRQGNTQSVSLKTMLSKFSEFD